MMTHQLAKKLKDAGYPQKSEDGKWNLSPYIFNMDNGDGVHAPSLSQLIEACGDKFLMLTQREKGKYWNAKAHWSDKNTNLLWEDTDGDTPEEAVANLWLELNKK